MVDNPIKRFSRRDKSRAADRRFTDPERQTLKGFSQMFTRKLTDDHVQLHVEVVSNLGGCFRGGTV